MYFMIVITGNYNFLSYCYKYFKLFCRKLSDRNEGLIRVLLLICNSKVKKKTKTDLGLCAYKNCLSKIQ